METLYIILPIFSLVFIGYVFKLFGLVKDEWVHALNGFIYYVSLPAIIISSFWDINWTQGAIWKTIGLTVLGLFLFTALFFSVLSFFKLPRKLKAALYLTAMFGNTVYMGLPLGTGLFGQTLFSNVISTATGYMVFGSIFGILVTDYFVSKPKAVLEYIVKFGKNPLISSLLFGIIFSLLQLHHPAFDIIKKPISMLGATASPLALFVLGSFLHGKFVKKHISFSLISIVLKIIILPLFMFWMFMIFGVRGTEQSISVLLAATPATVTCFVIAESYGLEETMVANTIVIGTILSLFTIPLILLLMHH